MAERDTSTDSEKRILVFDRKGAIQDRVGYIVTCKKLIAATNNVAKRFPELSEICAENITANKEFIATYTNEIRRIRNGATKLY